MKKIVWFWGERKVMENHIYGIYILIIKVTFFQVKIYKTDNDFGAGVDHYFVPNYC